MVLSPVAAELLFLLYIFPSFGGWLLLFGKCKQEETLQVSLSI